MAKYHEMRAKAGKLYYVRVSGGTYYVGKYGWLGRDPIASAKSMPLALAIIENHSGEKIRKVS
jgi:hypothetical protein